ncbi:hypothetical protein KTG17_23230, partial [Phocaeicola vulgatus]|nr:hypothetical protein [Phocaeicola vulgatus]MBU9033987.1 hypothetical protein [Phocaeicola vulgatus]MBU9055905.1 hypothetical protein [Phocaeicola vulgatus]
MKTNQNNEKTVPTQEQIEAACRQSARHFWNWLTWSLVYYVVINLFLIAINWFTVSIRPRACFFPLFSFLPL